MVGCVKWNLGSWMVSPEREQKLLKASTALPLFPSRLLHPHQTSSVFIDYLFLNCLNLSRFPLVAYNLVDCGLRLIVFYPAGLSHHVIISITRTLFVPFSGSSLELNAWIEHLTASFSLLCAL